MVNQKADPQDFRNAVLKHQLKSTDQKQNEQNAKTAQVIYQNEYNERKKKNNYRGSRSTPGNSRI